MNDIRTIAKQAITNAINEMVMDVIVEHSGWGIETELKAVIKERARKMVDEDVEIQKLLKDRIHHWIDHQ